MTDHAFNLKSVYERAMEKHGDRTAVRFDGGALTYAELDRRSNAVANALHDLGVGLEDRVALLMETRIEYLVAYLGLVKAGATEVPLNELLTDDEIAFMLGDSGAETVFCGPAFVETVADVRGETALERCVAIGESDPPPAFRSFDSLVEGYATASSPDVTPTPDHEVRHSYTGGTTGKPKGVVHTHRSRTTNLYAHVMELDITGDDRLLLMTPLPHSAGTFLTAALLAGATSVVRPGFDPEAALSDVEAHDVTWTFMVPTMIYRLLDAPELASADVASLRNVVYGAAPMTPARLREGIDAFGPVFTQFYGQTEVPNLITSLTKWDHESAVETGNEERLSSAGTPCLMSEVRIVDPETGETVPRGEIGEITARSPYTLREYHDRPDETRDTLRDGWVHTGDLGRRDDEGYVYLLDRKNDMIVTGGMNVYSIEVEEALDEHPDVREVAVIGVPDEEWGEAVTAVVVPREGADRDADALVAFAGERLAAYKKPKRVDFVDEIPTTPYGKMDKKALREQYWDEDDERRVS